MRIDHYVHIVQDAEAARFQKTVLGMLTQIISKENIIMADLNQALDDLEAQTAAIDGAEESAEAAFTRLADLIQSLKDGQTDPATAARIQAAADNLRAKAAALGAAVEASPQG